MKSSQNWKIFLKKNIVSGFSIFSILTPFVDASEALDFGGQVKAFWSCSDERTNKPGEPKPKDLLSSHWGWGRGGGGGGGSVGRFYLFNIGSCE